MLILFFKILYIFSNKKGHLTYYPKEIMLSLILFLYLNPTVILFKKVLDAFSRVNFLIFLTFFTFKSPNIFPEKIH